MSCYNDHIVIMFYHTNFGGAKFMHHNLGYKNTPVRLRRSFFSGLTPFLRRRWRTGVFLYPRAIICKIKWVKVEKIQNDYIVYGMWIAKIDDVEMRTLPHTYFLQTKHFWHHYFKI